MCPFRLSIQAWSVGVPGAAEVLGDRAQRQELAGRARGHLGPVVGDREQDRPRLVVVGEVDAAVVVAGIDLVQEAFDLECGGERELDLGGGLLDRDDLGDPLARDQVLDDQDRHVRGREVRRVVDPHRVRGVGDPVRERLAHRPARAWPGPEVLVSKEKNPPHR
jgi:hypothetical protein